MSSYQARIRAMFTPKPDGVYTKLIGQPELTARLVQQAWRRAGFPQVQAWVEPDEHGIGRVRTNLTDRALPPEPVDEGCAGALQMEQAA